MTYVSGQVETRRPPAPAVARRDGVRARAYRVGLVASMAVVSLNVWTGAPLLGLWVGSRVVGAEGQISMLAVAVVVLVIGAVALVLVRLLATLGEAHRRSLGRDVPVRQHLPWLRSMRGERPQYRGDVAPALTALEYVLVAVVVVAFVAFEGWFFFFSTSPIDQRSGRG